MTTVLDPMNVVDAYADEIPVPVFRILEELDLGPDRRDLGEQVSGWIERLDGGKYLIVVNSAHALVRQRFTAAHELGHFIYHRDLLGRGVGDTRAYRAEGTPYPNPEIRPVHERQANSFAANLLMPARAIRLLQEQGITEPKALAARLDVSVHAMCVRLGIPY
jgi:hypothetical protein